LKKSRDNSIFFLVKNKDIVKQKLIKVFRFFVKNIPLKKFLEKVCKNFKKVYKACKNMV